MTWITLYLLQRLADWLTGMWPTHTSDEITGGLADYTMWASTIDSI